MINAPYHVATQLAAKAAKTLVAYTLAADTGLEEKRDTLRARLYSLETEATWHRAGSAEAAFLQIGKARAIVEELALGGDGETLERILASLAGFIESATEKTRAEAGLSFYGDSETDAGLWL